MRRRRRRFAMPLDGGEMHVTLDQDAPRETIEALRNLGQAAINRMDAEAAAARGDESVDTLSADGELVTAAMLRVRIALAQSTVDRRGEPELDIETVVEADKRVRRESRVLRYAERLEAYEAALQRIASGACAHTRPGAKGECGGCWTCLARIPLREHGRTDVRTWTPS